MLLPDEIITHYCTVLKFGSESVETRIIKHIPQQVDDGGAYIYHRPYQEENFTSGYVIDLVIDPIDPISLSNFEGLNLNNLSNFEV